MTEERARQRRSPHRGAETLSARRRGGDGPIELEGTGFLGWPSQGFDTGAGLIDVVPLAAAIGGFEDVATVELTLGAFSVRVLSLDEVIASKEALGHPKDTAALPALYATREAVRRRREPADGRGLVFRLERDPV